LQSQTTLPRHRSSLIESLLSAGPTENCTLATPNYGYEKRQKELAKKRKKEEKLKAKAERKHGGPEDAGAESALSNDASAATPGAEASDRGISGTSVA
jgi:hypothetical protein